MVQCSLIFKQLSEETIYMPLVLKVNSFHNLPHFANNI